MTHVLPGWTYSRSILYSMAPVGPNLVKSRPWKTFLLGLDRASSVRVSAMLKFDDSMGVFATATELLIPSSISIPCGTRSASTMGVYRRGRGTARELPVHSSRSRTVAVDVILDCPAARCDGLAEPWRCGGSSMACGSPAWSRSLCDPRRAQAAQQRPCVGCCLSICAPRRWPSMPSPKCAGLAADGGQWRQVVRGGGRGGGGEGGLARERGGGFPPPN